MCKKKGNKKAECLLQWLQHSRPVQHHKDVQKCYLSGKMSSQSRLGHTEVQTISQFHPSFPLDQHNHKR